MNKKETEKQGNIRKMPIQKAEALEVGFSKVVLDIRNTLHKRAAKHSISFFNLAAGVGKVGVPQFSGGIIGNAGLLFEGLFTMAKQREDVRILIETTARALKADSLQSVVDLREFEKEHILSVMCVNALKDAGITKLDQLQKKKREEIASLKNLGAKSLSELDKLMFERAWNYLTEEKETPKG